VVDEPLGLSGYMQIDALNALMREGPAVSGAWLLIDRDQREATF
jgi:putative ABC transport system permease protein